MKDNSKEIRIKKIMDLFGEPDEKEFIDEIEKDKILLQNPKSLNSILSKFGKNEINKKTCKAILADIISSLLKDRTDFPIFMDIYIKMYVLS